MKKEYIYPFWLRFWHWLNALLFLILIISGISLHYSDPKSYWIPFDIAVLSHNISGVLLSLNYLFYFIFNIISGNYKQYIPKLKGLKHRFYLQAKYYVLGIFVGEKHPFETDQQSKFNPLQQIAYLFIMFVFMPIICISGWLLMFPELAPDELFGMGGVWPMALLHTIVGFFLSIFMFVHIYLGTTGNTIGELYKSMITGWHLVHPKETVKEVKPQEVIEFEKKSKKLFPIVFYNPMTLTGALLAVLSTILIALFVVIEFIVENPNPYLGIVTFIILPSILLLGLFLIAIGAIKENRRILHKEASKKKLPIIDLNNPKHQVATLVFSVGTIVLTVASIFGSFKAYEYTDSDEFCGQVCHTVMEPEFTAYKDSPHSKVGCVSCHIGPGTDWFVRSKLSGTYQVYSVLFKKYSRPIPTPVEHLRPAQQICEQCHWPEKFYHENKIVFDFFTQDEKNSEYKLSMNFKVGGGSLELGNSSGIHWVMNIANEISYYAADKDRTIIPWIKVKSRITGKETVYRDTSYKFPKESFKPDEIRIMDCIDCHNRPSHIYQQPNRVINTYMSSNLIDRNLPYIKHIGVQVLESYVQSRETSYKDIKDYITNYYRNNYPEIADTKQASIEQAVNSLNKIYLRNYFPYMKANWKNYPNHIGHMYSPGCYRCHDGKHVSDEGKVITMDCNACHTIVTQQIPNQPMQESSTGLNFIHPGGLDKLTETKNCVTCHGAFPSKKQKVDITTK